VSFIGSAVVEARAIEWRSSMSRRSRTSWNPMRERRWSPIRGWSELGAGMHVLIESHRAEIRVLAERHGLCDVRIFGSMARGEANDTSDVDLLVILPPGRTGLALGPS
jgi:UTP:GlnB (protein PII) uridylyltransferase